jgi:hypothetical protein
MAKTHSFLVYAPDSIGEAAAESRRDNLAQHMDHMKALVVGGIGSKYSLSQYGPLPSNC